MRSSVNLDATPSNQVPNPPQKMAVHIVFAIALAHCLNDLIQSSLPAIYPLLKENFALSFAQVGLISLVFQITASLLQPWVGFYTDKHPKPYLLPIGMSVTLCGIVLLAFAPSFAVLLLAAALIGVGSSTFHPEASRVARLASGGKFGTAQSAFQVGGNSGSAIGPLLAAAIIVPSGQASAAWLMVIAIFSIALLFKISQWSVKTALVQQHKKTQASVHQPLPKTTLLIALGIICFLMFAKFTYISSISNYYTFYLMDKFQLSLQQSQLYLFAFLGAVALGTFVGGPIGDRIGRKAVIWVSFIGMAPFALLMPYANLLWACIFAMLAGLIMSSAFSAMVVYAQEAMPGRVGMVSGMMFGLMFGISGIAAAVLGYVADHQGIAWVFSFTSYLPLLGLLTFFLPNLHHNAKA